MLKQKVSKTFKKKDKLKLQKADIKKQLNKKKKVIEEIIAKLKKLQNLDELNVIKAAKEIENRVSLKYGEDINKIKEEMEKLKKNLDYEKKDCDNFIAIIDRELSKLKKNRNIKEDLLKAWEQTKEKRIKEYEKSKKSIQRDLEMFEKIKNSLFIEHILSEDYACRPQRQ